MFKSVKQKLFYAVLIRYLRYDVQIYSAYLFTSVYNF